MSFIEKGPKGKGEEFVPDSGLMKKDSVKTLMTEGEEIVLTARIHGMIYWKSAAVLIIAILLYLVVPPLGTLLFVTSILMFIFNILKKHFLMLVLTNKRILTRYGILQVDVVDMPFDRVESVELERMIPGQIFGYSNVVVTGTGNRMVVIPFVANSIQFRKKFSQMSLDGKSSKSEDKPDKPAEVKEEEAETQTTSTKKKKPNFVLKAEKDD